MQEQKPTTINSNQFKKLYKQSRQKSNKEVDQQFKKMFSSIPPAHKKKPTIHDLFTEIFKNSRQKSKKETDQQFMEVIRSISEQQKQHQKQQQK